MNLEWLVALVGGLLIAAVTAPVGVSGAVFLLPFQMTVLAVPSPAVTPTNLVYNVVSVPGALARYRRHGNLRSSLTVHLIAGTLPGVVLGALIRVYLVPDGTVFRLLVAMLLLPLGLWLVFRAALRHDAGPGADGDRNLAVGWTVTLGAVAGVIGGVYGIGGGSLLAPVLVALGCSPRRVAPAALISTFLTSCVGVGAYAVLAAAGQGQAAPVSGIAVAAGIGGLIGGYLGAAIQPRVPARLLTAGLGAVSVVVAVFYAGALLT